MASIRYAGIVSGLVIVGIFAGCHCPKDMVEKSERTPAATIVEPEEKTPPATTVKDVKDTKEEGKATPTEIAKAIKDEDLPIKKIPSDKEFKDPATVSAEAVKIFKNIYFDFDKYDIRADARVILNDVGSYLLANPNVEVLIEGHCDERGTREYNLVLGEQRALSARRFLVGLGVSPDRLHTVSYGKDKPADPRSNEEAWALNRRDELKIAE